MALARNSDRPLVARKSYDPYQGAAQSGLRHHPKGLDSVACEQNIWQRAERADANDQFMMRSRLKRNILFMLVNSTFGLHFVSILTTNF
jgi:hypothetical protein